jgi:hypothetical protein
MLIIIFSYNREKWLKSLLKELKGKDYIVIDDGSDFKIEDERFIQLPHEGKKGFWKKWDYALKYCEKSNYETFMFIPDDFSTFDFDRIDSIVEERKEEYYIHHIINDGRDKCWLANDPIKLSDDLMAVGFVDCQFVTNRKTLAKLGYYMIPIGEEWFDRENKSSGVGYQLSIRMTIDYIPIYKPIKSMAYHKGWENSQMHPIHRKELNLKSI